VTDNQTTLFRAIAACALSVLLNLVVAAIGGSFKDAFAMPGAVVGMLGSVTGIYDTPSRAWAIACVVGNVVFYSAILWVMLVMATPLISKLRGESAV